jgi:iron(III) transport system ATP-binding protein
MTLSDRVVVMNQGLIEQVGTPMEIYRHPNTRFVADFIGRANFIEATVTGSQGESLVVEAFGQPLVLPKALELYHAGSPVTLVVRPEMIRIGKNEQGLKGIVRRAAYLGDSIDYEIELNGQTLTAVETDPLQMQMFAEGTQVDLNLCAECIHVIKDGQA